MERKSIINYRHDHYDALDESQYGRPFGADNSGTMIITFLGACGEVTGSCFLVERGGLRFLVDCGMFQGGREAEGKNLRALNFDLRRLDFVLLTHAHLDHAGLLPRLTSLGYRGPVYTTVASIDLLKVILLDAAYIQEKELEWQNQRNRSRKRRQGAVPLYTVAQAQACLRQLRGVDYGESFHPHPGVSVLMRDAGHILGSASVDVRLEEAGGHRLVFSGDLGHPGRPLMRDPEPVAHADTLLVESTYGNRLHRPLKDTEDELVEVLERTLGRQQGNVIVPAFSVGRTQEVLFVLAKLVKRGRLRRLRVYVDSPMALSATEITLKHAAILDEETHELIQWQRGNPEDFQVNFIQDVEESKSLNAVRSGAIIISASGMCDAGRIKYHLRYNLPRPECSVIFVGFQAAGTLGRRLVEGVRHVGLFGERVAVRAGIHTIGGLSAHADQNGLIGWLRGFKRAPSRTFVVHGEANTARAFADEIERQLGWSGVRVPAHAEQYRLEEDAR